MNAACGPPVAKIDVNPNIDDLATAVECGWGTKGRMEAWSTLYTYCCWDMGWNLAAASLHETLEENAELGFAGGVAQVRSSVSRWCGCDGDEPA